jgi:hypothetical protein
MSGKYLAASIAIAAGLLMATAPFASAQIPGRGQGGFAVVNPDGTLVQQHNVVGVTRTGTGVYEIQFNSPIRRCALEATIAGDPGFILPGYIVVSKLGTGVAQVNTFATLTLLPADFKFSLTDTCP